MLGIAGLVAMAADKVGVGGPLAFRIAELFALRSKPSSPRPRKVDSITIADSGHYMILDQPQAFADALDAFIK